MTIECDTTQRERENGEEGRGRKRGGRGVANVDCMRLWESGEKGRKEERGEKSLSLIFVKAQVAEVCQES